MENIFLALISIIFGAIFGSYGTLFAYRLPRGESCFGRYFGPKSRCSSCGSVILTRDLVPLINWLITFGKCRICKVKIPRIHLFVEFSTMILFLICYLNFGFSESFMIHALVAVSLVILLATDYTHKMLPQSVLIFLLFLVAINRILVEQSIIPMVYSASVGVLIVAMFYQAIFKKFPNFFIDQQHFLEYLKLILIASVAMNISMFLYFISVAMLSLLMLSLCNVLKQKNYKGLGYVFILPFIWLLVVCPTAF